MAIPKRHGQTPGTYFVTSRTWESRLLFARELVCQLFVESLLHYRAEGHYSIHAFVFMPDHFHLLLTPSLEMSLERAVQFIKGGSARRIGKELNLSLPVWQRGFSDHRIRDFEDYERHVRYIEQNPVKKKLVVQASEYAWGSAGGRFQMDEPPQRLKPLRDSIDMVLRHG